MVRSFSGVPSPTKDPEIEERIENEIVVDAYGEYERHGSWQTHLGDHLPFPFQARCIKQLPGSPLRRGETATVTGLFDEAEPAPIRVMIRWQERELAVPLEQVVGANLAEDAAQAIADWHYWCACGYQF